MQKTDQAVKIQSLSLHAEFVAVY